MTKKIKLKTVQLNPLRTIDKRLVSYNIEMTEVTGGTFWKAYTPEQIAGEEPFTFDMSNTENMTQTEGLMQYFPPIDLRNERIRALAKELGSAWIRTSGTWASKTYYDFEGTTGGVPPKGYDSVLTKEQWTGVLDFVKAVDGKLLISVSNCAGDHPHGGALDLTQTKKIFDFSHKYGVDIAAAEFMNEPNILEMSGAPKGYTAEDYVRDADIFNAWVKENYPDCLLVGPCTTDGVGDNLFENAVKEFGGSLGKGISVCSTDDLMKGAKIPLDVFSYHYYNCVSERIAGMMPSAHFDGSEAHGEKYLSIAPMNARKMTVYRDKYVPNAPIWVTESGDACGGGNTWGSTYLDVIRTLNELGSFAAITDGVIFHNTLASSDYGFLQHGSFEPRPNYFAVLLWNRLMGTTVYDCGNPDAEGAHVYCHSRRDNRDGVAYLIINNSLTESIAVELPKAAELYCLTAEHSRASTMLLNGRELAISEVADLPDLSPETVQAGEIILPPLSCNFIVL